MGWPSLESREGVTSQKMNDLVNACPRIILWDCMTPNGVGAEHWINGTTSAVIWGDTTVGPLIGDYLVHRYNARQPAGGTGARFRCLLDVAALGIFSFVVFDRTAWSGDHYFESLNIHSVGGQDIEGHMARLQYEVTGPSGGRLSVGCLRIWSSTNNVAGNFPT